MIATRSVERGYSALHNSSQLHSRVLILPSATLHTSRLIADKNNSHNSFCRHNLSFSRPVQQRHAHTSVPFGWTGLTQDGSLPPPDENPRQDPRRPIERAHLPYGTPFRPGPLLPSDDSARSGSITYYHAAVEALLCALRKGDTFQLYLCLMNLVRGYETESGARVFTEAVASIPATTFSEILRSFDPNNIADKIDTAPGLNISWGVAVHTPLGELVNKWGVKVLYVRILRRLRRIQLARRQAKIVPLLNDYVVMIRCAGATSDIGLAKDVWLSMTGDHRANFRHSELYTEFIKARYLTEKIYANNDLVRLRLRPLDMHRSSLNLPGKVHLKLRHLSARITDLRKHRFGSNAHERFFDEPLTMLLRKRDPLRKLERTAWLRVLTGSGIGEELICALLKANGRAGRLRANNSLLKKHWGVLIHIDKETDEITLEGGHTYPPGSPRAPTAVLLDAIVQGYCCQGEVALATRLLDFMSQRFNIPVPDHVWSDLIEYTRVMQTKPVQNEWAIAKFRRKATKADHVLQVWALCTEAPYSFQPQARDYYNLIRSLVKQGQPMVRPIEALRQIRPLYEDVVDACEQAWCELMQTTGQRVTNLAAFRRYKVLQARRNYMWYMFHHSIYLILKDLRPGRSDDQSAVREIPKLLGDFEQFLPLNISYKVATGVLEFSSDNALEKNMVEVKQAVMKSPPLSEAASSAQDDGDDEWLQEPWEDEETEGEHLLQQLLPAESEVEAVSEDQAVDSKSSATEDEQVPEYISTPQWASASRESEKPAYLYRPRFSGPSDQLSMLTIRRDGGEFTGFYDDPLRRHFAAHRLIRTTRRVVGVPVDMVRFKDRRRRHAKMVDEVLRMRT
ncbi:hypothetical protein J7T55_014926 [Diaporthe amygdali]|uniref:uncharacterized protein n=1 Tax=Phomopsis amygdali TaxID=1214568 RepID=UPI0022FF3717|nr:uncharacterized protein J7T55_014926 [Diaporthe amygdali]KAJ0106850.1 hypothetical protein J7T55_014926 [Diaporthe amygdali]